MFIVKNPYTLLPRIQVHALICVAEAKVHALLSEPKLAIFGDEKSRCASYISAYQNLSNLSSIRKSSFANLLFDNSIRFKNEKRIFQKCCRGFPNFYP